MKGETIAFAHGVKRTYAQHLVEYLAELYGEYCEEKRFSPNALLLPCSMFVALKADCSLGCSAFDNQYLDRFMDCEVVVIDERDCKEADYVPRFFRRSNPKDI